MTTVWLKSVDSTQTYLLDQIKSGACQEAQLIATHEQIAGRGSRGNVWLGLEGNLFFSFCVDKDSLPKDLPLSAVSIYFSFLLKQVLAKEGSLVWMKWPNDFYLDDLKIGGTITQISGKWSVCGIGLNLKMAPEGFNHLDIKIDSKKLLDLYTQMLEFLPPWKKLLKEFKIEFTKSKNFSTHVEGEKVALKDAELADDGALVINGQRIYSLR